MPVVLLKARRSPPYPERDSVAFSSVRTATRVPEIGTEEGHTGERHILHFIGPGSIIYTGQPKVMENM
jgi:hypothetical protein